MTCTDTETCSLELGQFDFICGGSFKKKQEELQFLALHSGFISQPESETDKYKLTAPHSAAFSRQRKHQLSVAAASVLLVKPSCPDLTREVALARRQVSPTVQVSLWVQLVHRGSAASSSFITGLTHSCCPPEAHTHAHTHSGLLYSHTEPYGQTDTPLTRNTESVLFMSPR